MKKITREILLRAKRCGFSDRQLARIWKTDEITVRKLRRKLGVEPVYKTVDTCAAEFEAETPYHYSTYETEDELVISDRKKVIILGGGPNRIGQGIEFDYCCVHGVFALEEEGFETIMVNCNPETVSTDYDQVDKLYFEPLTLENVLDICEREEPDGVIISFGGQTPLKLAKSLEAQGVRILGTSPDDIDVAEDRKRFGALLKKLHIPHPADGTATSPAEALKVASKIGYPVLVRPSYVLGGRAMEIVYDDDSLGTYMEKAVDASPEHPVLIDKFLEDAREFDVDAVCDGTDVLIGGVLHHIQEAGIHSGDSTSVLTPSVESRQIVEQLKDFTRKLALALNVKGLINVQFAEKGGIVYVLEVNPRASRTVPFISKAMGIPLAKIAAKIMVGRKLKDLGYDLETVPKYIAVKEPVFPFNKFPQTKIFLGPEMRSTGEVMSMSESYGEAIAKAVLAAGGNLPVTGGIFISVNNNDKNHRLIRTAQGFLELGFRVYATRGTSLFLDQAGVQNTMIYKANEGRPNVVDYIKNGDIQLVVNTPLGEASRFDEKAIGKAALEEGRLVITSVSGMAAGLEAVKWYRDKKGDVRSLQDYHGTLAKGPEA